MSDPAINIGRLSESINNKADRDLNNLNSTGSAKIAIKQYSSTLTFALNDVVLGTVSGRTLICKSLIPNNIGNPLTDPSKWEILNLGGTTRNIGEIIWSLTPLTDTCLCPADGSVKYGDGIYSDFVEYMADLSATSKIDIPFSQPILSADGTMGGDEFACSASSAFSEVNYGPAYMAFDGDSTTAWHSQDIAESYITFYNPQALNITKLTFTNWNATGITVTCPDMVKISVSNDGTNFIDVALGTSAGHTEAGGVWDVDVIHNGYYKYCRVTVLSSNYAGHDYAVIGSIDITATYRDYLKIFCSEEEWWNTLNTYGVCGKFVYDEIANSIRLPKIDGFLEGTLDPTKLGDLVQAGLPNITGSTHASIKHDINGTSGAFTQAYSHGTSYQYSTGNLGTTNAFGFDASLSNPIYGGSDTVQPQAIKVLFYICIATVTKTDVEVDIDNIATDLNGKADVDLANLNDTGKITIVHNAMPSDTYTDLTLDENGAKYTAPTDGFAYIHKACLTDVYWDINLSSLDDNDNIMVHKSIARAINGSGGILLAVRKNQKFVVSWYNGSGGSVDVFRFYYAVGSESDV